MWSWRGSLLHGHSVLGNVFLPPLPLTKHSNPGLLLCFCHVISYYFFLIMIFLFRIILFLFTGSENTVISVWKLIYSSFFRAFSFFFFFIFAVDAQQKACVLSPESLSWGRALSSSSLSWVLAGGFSPFSPTGKLLVCQIIACQKMSPGVGSCQVVWGIWWMLEHSWPRTVIFTANIE